jgi:hypothetical protein
MQPPPRAVWPTKGQQGPPWLVSGLGWPMRGSQPGMAIAGVPMGCPERCPDRLTHAPFGRDRSPPAGPARTRVRGRGATSFFGDVSDAGRVAHGPPSRRAQDGRGCLLGFASLVAARRFWFLAGRGGRFWIPIGAGRGSLVFLVVSSDQGTPKPTSYQGLRAEHSSTVC